jgi:hypothetical protein
MYGFCDAVLMREDSGYEYIATPQDRHRFGKHIFYNSLSQRNGEIEKPDSNIICAFGDSFINGGTPTDQDSLATTKLTAYLTNKYKKKIEVLNISAGSWGPDNCYAYLLKHGDFRSKHFMLFVSSHDAYDDMDFHKVVGINPQFPVKQYSLAVVELFDRYLIPKLLEYFGHSTDLNEINKKTPVSVFNTGFINFYNYSKKANIAFTIYIHADKEEATLGHYNEQGQMIIDFCKEKNIRLLKELDFNFPLSSYRDGIHFNEQGQEKCFEAIKDSILLQ